MNVRHRADPLQQLKNVSGADHATLRQGAADKTVTWSPKDPALAALVADFKAEVKEYYYWAQRRRCCYCSFELQGHKLTYDAEHILDKDDYPEHTFELTNLAAVCKHCNISKSNQSISSSGTRFPTLSLVPDHYRIVHPHLDEWSVHLRFDEIGRIQAVPASSKGVETIRICKIGFINAARLSDEFSLRDRPQAEQTLREFHEDNDLARKKELLDLIAELARRYDHPGSRAIVAHLADELGKSVAQLGLNAAALPQLPAP